MLGLKPRLKADWDLNYSFKLKSFIRCLDSLRSRFFMLPCRRNSERDKVIVKK